LVLLRLLFCALEDDELIDELDRLNATEAVVDGMDGRFFLTLDQFQVLMSLCMVGIMVVESHHQEGRDVLGP
jgi:hypothetical protein